TSSVVSVVLPAPDNPVIHKVNPFCFDMMYSVYDFVLIYIIRAIVRDAAYASINTCATSGLENSIGGNCPAFSSSRTLVPESVTCCDCSCGHVFVDAIAPHDLQ